MTSFKNGATKKVLTEKDLIFGLDIEPLANFMGVGHFVVQNSVLRLVLKVA